MLPIFQTSSKDVMLLQTQWAPQLNAVLRSPTTNPTLLHNITLTAGVNVINHKLGTTPVGWMITDINAPVTIYRSAAFNPLTLTLTSSGSAVISLAVF